MKTLFYRFILAFDGFALFLCGAAFVDYVLHPLAGDYTYGSVFFQGISIFISIPLTLLVGFLIIRRVPGNIVGPLLILWSGTLAFGSLREDISPSLFTIFSTYDMTVGWFGLSIMLLHFPDGKVYPPRAARWLYLLSGASIDLGVLISLGTASRFGVANPFVIPALQKVLNPLSWTVILFILVVLIMIPISMMLRYRKSGLLERQQIKWLALFGALMAAATILGAIVFPLLTGGNFLDRPNNLFSLIYFTLTGFLPPLAIGISVLRYRLWDIDIIIRRTLLYSALTVVLTTIYLSGVLLLQEVFQVFTGEHQSPVATVISTLLIVALFNPLHHRIQSGIDRRFYRQKYDSERVLAAFGAAVREETDLDELSKQVVSIVQDTVQPESVGLWLKPTKNRSLLEKG